MDEAQSIANDALAEIYVSGRYSDLTVACGEHRYYVHKAIVCPRSSFFAKACEEGRWKEGHENFVTLKDEEGATDEEVSNKSKLGYDDPDAVRCMFDFMYMHTYEATIATQDDDPIGREDSICLHAKVYALADKYNVPALKNMALKKFKESAKSEWKGSNFQSAVEIAFTTTPDQDADLRDAVVQTLQEHRRDLSTDSDMERIIRNISGLAYRLWSMPSSGPSCSVCGSVHIRECSICAQGNTKRSSTRIKNMFLTCDCKTEQYCQELHYQELHEGSPEFM